VARGCDHLVVLGVGRKMLDDSISNALATHVLLAGNDPPPSSTIAAIRTEAGESVYVLRNPDLHIGPTRPATLDDVVMAYLTAGRSASTQARAA
jgi:hypothetical protein